MNTRKQTRLEANVVDHGVHSEVGRFLADVEPFFHAKPVVYIDAGAHKGHIFREVLASGLKLKAAHLIEPNPASFAELEATVRALEAEAVAKCYNLALAAEPQMLRLREAGDMTKVIGKTARSDQTPAPTFTKQTFESEAVTLDAILGELPKGHGSILKIDVEGYEREVLAGAATLLDAQALDLIYVEAGIEPGNTQQTYYRDLEDTLRTSGYRLFRIYEQKNEWEEDSPFLRRINLAFLSERFAARTPYKLTRKLVAAQREGDALEKALGEARREGEAAETRCARLETLLEEARENVAAKTEALAQQGVEYAEALAQQGAEHAEELARQGAGHAGALARRDLALTDGRQQREARMHETKELEAQLASRSEEIVKLTRGLEGLQTRIDELMRSTSWRVSAPVRGIGRLLRRR